MMAGVANQVAEFQPQSDAWASSQERPRVWVVVAAYCEGPRLGDTLDELCAVYENVIVVDDGSTDQTAEVARRRPAWVLQHAVNCGQGAALQTGIDFAVARGAEVLVTFDADGQHLVADIDRLVTPILRGEAQVALGSRFLGRAENIPRSRWWLLKAAVLFTRLFSRIRVTDTHNGLRAFSRAAAQQVRITHDRYAHASDILDQIRSHRLRYVEVPVTIRYLPLGTKRGQSSWNAVRITAQLLLGRIVR